MDLHPFVTVIGLLGLVSLIDQPKTNDKLLPSRAYFRFIVVQQIGAKD